MVFNYAYIYTGMRMPVAYGVTCIMLIAYAFTNTQQGK
jgi:hypothetical protein